MKRILIFIVAVMMVANVFAQTAYQSKCHQIFTKYMKTFVVGMGDKWGQTEEFAFSQSGYSENGAMEVLLMPMMGYCAKTGKSYEAMKKQVEAEYIAARNLMTPEEKFAMKVDEESKVPYGRAKWQSAVDFKKWMKKGEYETTEQQESRLNVQSRPKMNQIIFENVVKEISEDYWKMEFDDYDADNQELKLHFVDNERHYQIPRVINVSPQTAKYIKIHCHSGDPKLYNDGAIQTYDDDGMDDNGNMKTYWDEKGKMFYDVKRGVLKMQYETYELCVINNEIFVPRYFYITSSFGEWQFDISATEPLAIFNYDDWVGKPQQLNEYIFDYQEYGKKVRAEVVAQAAYEDSIAIANFNSQLDELLNSYNQKLKDNKYNIKQLCIKRDDYVMKVNDETLFKDNRNKMQNEYEKYRKQIQDDYWELKDKYFKIYGTIEEFDKYYCQGLDVFLAQTDYRNVMQQLKQKQSSIAQVNFQKEMNNNSFMNVISEQPVDYTEINEYRRQLLEWVATLKSKPYYDEVLTYLINNNAAFAREFAKNGSKFSSKSEFYEAYTSGDYKAVLKGRK